MKIVRPFHKQALTTLFKKMRWAPVFALICCGALTVAHSALTQELDGDPVDHIEGTPDKVWDVGTSIDPGVAKVTSGIIDWNQTAQVSVEGAKDSDHWKDGDKEDTEADEVTYQWSGSGTFASPNAASSQWTPPTLPSDNASFTYKLFCTVDDKPTPIGVGERGTRDDRAPDHLMVEVKVTRKKWDKGSAIQLGGPITSDVVPQPSLQGGMKLYVEQGQQVHLNIPTATDDDHWVYRDTEDTEADEVNYTWSGVNILSNTKGQSITWTAPSLPGQISSAEVPLICTVDDKPTAIDTAKGETGTRNDDPDDKSTITFVVVKTVWSPNKGIGFHPQLDAQGHFDKYNPTWIPDGQVVSPKVNATTGKASAMSGEHVVCALSEAQDWDSWTKGDMAGPAGADLVEDFPLTYRWTATHGQFLVGEGENAHLQNSADTRGAIWVVPDDIPNDTDVTLKCTVNDPAGDHIGVNEAGTRNDEALERTVNVIVVKAKASASFKVLKADGTEADASGTIGGAVTVVLEVELENTKAGSASAVARIQETGTEGGVHHEPEEDHIDLPALDFTRKDDWQQWLDTDGDGPLPASWQTAISQPVGTGKWRRSYPWNTAGAAIPMGNSTLLNHNGAHLISLVKVDGSMSNTLKFGDKSVAVEEKKVTVGNLVIADAKASDGNLDFVRFDKNSDNPNVNHPSISFRVVDADFRQGDTYFCIVAFPETNYAVMPTLVGTLTEPSTTTFQLPQSSPRGVFGFNVIVKKSRGGQQVDQQFLRSQLVGISKTEENLVGPDGEEKVNYEFRLGAINPSQTLPAFAKVGVDLIDASYEKDSSVEVPDPIAVGIDASVELPERKSDIPGEARNILRGTDNSPLFYRDHSARRMIAKNKVDYTYEVILINGAEVPKEIDRNGGKAPNAWNRSIRTRLPYGRPPGQPGSVATLTFSDFVASGSMNDTDWTKKAWQTLVRKGRANLRGGSWPNATLVHYNGHGNPTSISLGHNDSGHTRWSNTAVNSSTSDDYNITTPDAPILEGTSNFFLQECGGASGATGEQHDLVAASGSIATQVVTKANAHNSVGFTPVTYPGMCPIYNGTAGQVLYNSFYRFGLMNKGPNSYNNYSGRKSMMVTEYQFKSTLQGVGGFTDAEMRATGYLDWVVTKPSTPFLDTEGR